jgi:transcriptional regulator with XRE-family HTH domain
LKEEDVMLTSIGRFLRKLRIDRDEILMDMAAKLEVTPAYLSAIENGKRVFPEKWKTPIIRLYSLNEEQQKEFNQAILESIEIFELNVEKANKPKRKLAYTFARRFKDLDEDTVNAIKDLLGDIDYE